jgi:endonuclease YncB( thermonuclease family)
MRAKREGQHRRPSIGLRGLPSLLMLIICAPISATSAEVASTKAQSEPPASTCPDSATDRAAIANIDERLEITLKDGRSLRLAGLEPPRPTPDAPDFDISARDALKARAGDEIAFTLLAQKPDRWGRIPVFAFFDQPGAEPVSAGQVLLAQGFARFMPEPEARPCRTLFLAAEAAARSANLGLWRDPFYAVIKATDHDAFAERAATNVIVEGRLTGVDKGPLRTYLQFAPRRERAFSVTILQRNVKKLEQAGFDFSALIGRTLRVRGLLDLRFGPQIEVSGADEIELLPEAEGDRGLEPRGSR